MTIQDPTSDMYDDHLFIDDGTDEHLCAWGRSELPGSQCGDAADSQCHANDPSVITTPVEEFEDEEDWNDA